MRDSWVFEYERPLCLLDVDLFAKALRDDWLRILYGLNCPFHHYKFVQGRQYRREQELFVFDSAVEKQFDEDPSSLARYASKVQEACDLLSLKSNSMSDADWNMLSTEQLAQSLQDFVALILPVATAILAVPNTVIEKRILSVLQALKTREDWGESPGELVAIINSSAQRAVYREEPLALLEIAAKIQDNPAASLEFSENKSLKDIAARLPTFIMLMIESHCRRYSWLNLPYTAVRRPYAVLDYLQRLQNLVARSQCTQELTRINNLRAKDAERFTEMIKATHTEEEAALITAAQDFAFLRTHAATVFDRALVDARDSLLAQIGARLKLSDPEIASMSTDELLGER